MKTCTTCKVVKPITEFYNDNRRKDKKCHNCKTCGNARKKAWREANLEKDQARQRAWGLANPEKLRTNSRRANARRYGLTLEQYDAIVDTDRCEACGTKEPRSKHGKFHLDHCHTTGRVRGALCSPCNVSLGNMNDDPERIIALAMYAERHHAITLAS